VITVEPRTDVGAAVRLLFAHNIGGLPVVEAGGKVVGFLAERDVVRAMNGQMGLIRHMPVRDAMRPAQFCEADDTIEYAMRLMTSERVRHLVVRDHERMIGVLSVGDMVKFRLEQLETETAVLRDYVAAHRAAG
jgi:CBS domain-containing protein